MNINKVSALPGSPARAEIHRQSGEKDRFVMRSRLIGPSSAKDVERMMNQWMDENPNAVVAGVQAVAGGTCASGAPQIVTMVTFYVHVGEVDLHGEVHGGA